MVDGWQSLFSCRCNPLEEVAESSTYVSPAVAGRKAWVISTEFTVSVTTKFT